MLDWLPFFRQLTDALQPVVSLFGTEAAREKLGKGAGGDTTLRIDRDAETIILDALEAHSTNTGQGLTVISEEAGKIVFGDGSLLVLVDPIDGSANAKRGLPLYATTLAIAEGPEMEDLRVGFTINHASGESFYADTYPKGHQPRHHRILYNWSPHIPHTDLADDYLEMLGLEMPDEYEDMVALAPLLKAFKKTRVMGAMALDIAYVGVGGLDAFIHPKLSRPIDFAGSCVFVEAAGGVVCGEDGGPLQANLADLGRGPKVFAFRTKAIQDITLSLLRGQG